MQLSRWVFGFCLAAATLTAVPAPAAAVEFFDDVPETHTFHGDIAWLLASTITRGCNPPDNDRFCPDEPVTRGQMAAFLVRAMEYTQTPVRDVFVDDDGSVFERQIDTLAGAGVTRGCNPPDNDRFCPDEPVTRGQMAAFLVRAMEYTKVPDGDVFVDDDHSVFERDIERLAVAGVTRGCNPPDNDRFCPDEPVTRGQMAAFIHRAFGGGVIGGIVYEDADLDGQHDPGELSPRAAEVELRLDGAQYDVAGVDSSGRFLFGSVPPGSYTVAVLLFIYPGSIATTPAEVAVDVDGLEDHLDLEFGLRTPGALAEQLVGSWSGTNSNPWTDPYAVTAGFRSDGTYSANSDSQYWALYFGPDDDTPLKTYDVTSVLPSGAGQGTIAFVWVDNVVPTVRVGELRTIVFSGPDDVVLEIWDRATYGPVYLDLQRIGD